MAARWIHCSGTTCGSRGGHRCGQTVIVVDSQGRGWCHDHLPEVARDKAHPDFMGTIKGEQLTYSLSDGACDAARRAYLDKKGGEA